MLDVSLWNAPMSFRLVYRHGSLRRNERVSSVSAAMTLAIDLKRQSHRCREFCVYDSFGQEVPSEGQILAEIERHPTPMAPH
jgi:hypothetical protein